MLLNVNVCDTKILSLLQVRVLTMSSIQIILLRLSH